MNLTTWWRHFWLPACLLLVAITHTVSSETRVVCYYTNWSVYRPGTAKFSPQNINPYLCTHLIYAFGGFTKENSLKPFDKYQDIEKGGYAKFTGLKTYNKNLKTMLAIGGWNEGSSRFSPMVASSERRRELVKNAVKFLRQNHFDGLDLDWEYPSFRDGGKARDKENYAQLVQELREEFDRESEKTGRPRLLLTMAVPAGIEYINKGYDIPKLNRYLDWMNILSYDYHSAFEPAVNHHAPLYPLEEDNEYNFDADLNIDHTIKHYLKLGADPSKLVLGIPTYGRSYTLFNPDANELGAPADGPGDMGDATRENGYLAFYEICENLKENDWKVVQPNPDAMGPYAYKGNQWVSYDDEVIAKKKSVYVAENNLGGIMFWSIDNDDFRGNCYNKPYPLIEAAKEALLTAASRQTEENLVKPRKPSVRTRRPTSSSRKVEKDTEVSNTRVRNSGGPQTFEDDSSNSQKRTRPISRGKPRSEDTEVERTEERKRTRARGQGRRRKTTTTQSTTLTSTTPSTLPTTPMYRTPEPPTTPDPGGDFKCEEDGFFPHPRDCKKYFWCLSGPADLGIIAHQFTCPAGLYFNKAADSCDYTQNVLCKKKSPTTSKTTSAPSTTASTTTTTNAPTFSTRRASPRITAATSRTTYLYTSTSTTTPEPEYYDEYEYEDEEDLEDAPRRGEPDSEEDPRVIKELIDLIKKVGGVEELEKYLKLQENGSMAVSHSGSTTPASISRSLYERVLQSRVNAAKTSGNTVTDVKSRNPLLYSTINRNRQGAHNEGLEKPETVNENTVKRSNSRFTPQNAGLENVDSENDGSSKRGKPKYTTISRQRASTERIQVSENEDEEIDDEEDEVETKRNKQFLSRKPNTPEYVTIRRSRPTSSTDPEEENEETNTRSSIVRNRNRGVLGEGDEGVTDATQRPEYVTIRRNRPVSEEATTSKYTTIQRRRPTTEPTDEIETSTSFDIEPEKRRSTTQTLKEEVSLEKEKRYRSTTLPTTDESLTSTTSITDITLEDNKTPTTDKETVITENIEVKTTLEESTDKVSTQTLATELPSSSLATQSTTIEASTEASNQVTDQTEDKQTTSEKNSPPPQLFRPRPFATRTRSTTTPKPTNVTEATTKKPSRPYFFRRPALRFTPGRATLSSTSAPASTTTQRPTRSTSRRRYTARDGHTNNASTGAAANSSGSLGTSASYQVVISTTPKPRFKFASRRPFLKKTTSSSSTETTSTTSAEVEDITEEDGDDSSNETNDQTLESSIQRVKSQEHQDNGNAIRDLEKGNKGSEKSSLEQIGDIGLSLNPLQKVVPGRRRQPLRTTTTTSTTTEKPSSERNTHTFDRLRTRQRNRFSTTSQPQPDPTTTTTTPAPAVVTRSTLRRRRPQPQPFDKVVTTQAPIIITTGSYRPITIEYDYYDEGDVRILGQLPANSKVLIHASGAIQCLDQGNFPHPVSCKKFISCAKMENGDVIGWEYTCPNRLSFDPVGGICNWSAGLGCKE